MLTFEKSQGTNPKQVYYYLETNQLLHETHSYALILDPLQ